MKFLKGQHRNVGFILTRNIILDGGYNSDASDIPQ